MFSEYQRECALVGRLAIRKGSGAFQDLSPRNEALAELYSYCLFRWLLKNGGGNMQDFYCSEYQPEDIAMYLAVHNLRNRGVIVCIDPYDMKRYHTEVEILLVDGRGIEGWGEFNTRRMRSIAATRIGAEVKKELETFRKELFSG